MPTLSHSAAQKSASAARAAGSAGRRPPKRWRAPRRTAACLRARGAFHACSASERRKSLLRMRHRPRGMANATEQDARRMPQLVATSPRRVRAPHHDVAPCSARRRPQRRQLRAMTAMKDSLLVRTLFSCPRWTASRNCRASAQRPSCTTFSSAATRSYSLMGAVFSAILTA